MYRVIPDAMVSEQVAELPDDALAAYTGVLSALEVATWNGLSRHEDNPDGALRRWSFGPGQAIYLILDE